MAKNELQKMTKKDRLRVYDKLKQGGRKSTPSDSHSVGAMDLEPQEEASYEEQSDKNLAKESKKAAKLAKKQAKEAKRAEDKAKRAEDKAAKKAAQDAKKEAKKLASATRKKANAARKLAKKLQNQAKKALPVDQKRLEKKAEDALQLANTLDTETDNITEALELKENQSNRESIKTKRLNSYFKSGGKTSKNIDIEIPDNVCDASDLTGNDQTIRTEYFDKTPSGPKVDLRKGDLAESFLGKDDPSLTEGNEDSDHDDHGSYEPPTPKR